MQYGTIKMRGTLKNVSTPSKHWHVGVSEILRSTFDSFLGCLTKTVRIVSEVCCDDWRWFAATPTAIVMIVCRFVCVEMFIFGICGS